MSIELYEARRKLDIFEKGVNNPEIFMVPPYTITRLNNNTVEKKKLSDFVSNPKNIKNIFWNNYQDGCVHIIKSLS